MGCGCVGSGLVLEKNNLAGTIPDQTSALASLRLLELRVFVCAVALTLSWHTCNTTLIILSFFRLLSLGTNPITGYLPSGLNHNSELS